MVGATDVVQPWMPRAARESDACLWHVSLAGGPRRRGCAAAGVSEFLDGPLEAHELELLGRVVPVRPLVHLPIEATGALTDNPVTSLSFGGRSLTYGRLGASFSAAKRPDALTHRRG